MEVGAEHAPGATALQATLPVVAEAGQHAAERLGAVLEDRPARVVLEAGERAPLARLERALEQDVADHPALAGDRVQRQQAHTGQLVAALVAVDVPEELISAADR